MPMKVAGIVVSAFQTGKESSIEPTCIENRNCWALINRIGLIWILTNQSSIWNVYLTLVRKGWTVSQ